jgi:phosphoglycerol transferase MdoB-like AlkP superfamily enzyme
MMGRITSDPRIRAPVLLFLLVMAALSLQRLVILSMLSDRFFDVPRADLARSFAVGCRFDVWVAAVLTAPLVAMLAVSWPTLMKTRRFQNAVAAFGAAAYAILAFVCIADYYFFEEFNERLNHKALDYLGYPAIYALIWHEYPVIRALVAVAGILLGMRWVFRRAAFPPGFDSTSVRRLVVWLVIVVPLLAIAIRGSLGLKAINSSPAYFSNAGNVSQLTLNGPFAFREALFSRTLRGEDLARWTELLPENEAFALTCCQLARPEDRFLGDANNPLRRITEGARPQKDYNVVLVVLESLSWRYVGAFGGDPTLTPTLNALSRDGIVMDHCFAVGTRTTRGFAGIVSGHPDLPGESVTVRSEVEGNFLTLGHILRRRGYETMFIYAGQPLFDRRQAFLRSNGYSRMIFEDQVESRTFRTVLGLCDEDMFNQAHREFVAMGDRPFFATLLTISLHRPFETPPGRRELIDPSGKGLPLLNCIRYVDWTIGHFLEQARRAAYFNRTIFVFVTDHAAGIIKFENTPAAYRIPFLIYAPGILESPGWRVSVVCSQTDVAPTIMSILGGSYEHCFYGSNVLDRPPEAGMAMMQSGSTTIFFMVGNGDTVEIPCGAPPRLLHFTYPGTTTPVNCDSADTIARREELRRRAIAILQAATLLFERGTYHLAERSGSEGRASR